MKMECVYHKDETVIMVCTHCDKYPFVCAICVEEDHAEHRLASLRSAAQSIRQELEQAQSNNLHVFEEIKSDLDNLAKIRENLQQGAHLVENQMVKRQNIMKSEVDTVKNEVHYKHQMELGKNMEAIDKTEQALKQQFSQIATFQRKVVQLKNMNDYVDMIVTGRNVEVPQSSRRIPRLDIHALVFLPGAVRDGELERMFGSIKGASDHANNNENKRDKSSDFFGLIERKSKIKVTPVTSFKLSKHVGVDNMFCPKSKVCWLKCQDKNSVKLSNRSGEIKQAINLGTRSDGFTVSADNKLLFCCTLQKCIKEIALPNGEITEKLSTCPLTPNRICTDPSGDIYVTLCDEDDYEVTDDSTRVLVRYDRWGEEAARCQADGYGGSLFVVPEDVCVNNTGTRVAVINRVSDRRRELVVLDEDLSPVLIYTGPRVLTGDSLAGYSLYGVVFDTRDNILVAECYSKTVQLLSPSCEPLKVLLTMNTTPWAMTIQGNEVWIGDEKGKVQIFRYSY
ncbi:uncharacterized protein LOC110441417 isoform X2 [Mizuhopecten yessoensis]|uniref:uncharacterized protein LOC110441417 isoform X2 n=1 Tax=Mizuhopecten yessoensis TaxID=6573 RepID=UPI000B45AA02|nr:uncharacterized protein LOC110441417 isoform X2 [Mizuhopecten yessoensis]